MFIRAFFIAAAIAMTGSILAPIAAASPYANCSEARADGVCNIPQNSDKYQAKLDRDSDGIGCEC